MTVVNLPFCGDFLKRVEAFFNGVASDEAAGSNDTGGVGGSSPTPFPKNWRGKYWGVNEI